MLNGKMFVDKSNNIVGLRYTPDIKVDYYTYIRTKLELGYKQLIITADMMINIIEHMCINRNFNINEIELLENDENQQTVLSNYIELIKNSEKYFYKLMEELKFIKQESSVDIKKVGFIGKSADGKYFRLYIQVNGIYGVDNEFFESETREIIEILNGKNKNE
ncbi:hypothetical protein [Clostridium baratii]|uniref:hypothetical protein n=1 Tax=Clostridium baratii TaxID=1561 RepID=UPI003D349514